MRQNAPTNSDSDSNAQRQNQNQIEDENAIGLDRRTFVKGVGATALGVTALGLTESDTADRAAEAQAEASDDGEPVEAGFLPLGIVDRSHGVKLYANDRTSNERIEDYTRSGLNISIAVSFDAPRDVTHNHRLTAYRFKRKVAENSMLDSGGAVLGVQMPAWRKPTRLVLR